MSGRADIRKEAHTTSGRSKDEEKRSGGTIHDDNISTLAQKPMENKKSKHTNNNNLDDDALVGEAKRIDTVIDDLKSKNRRHDVLIALYSHYLRQFKYDEVMKLSEASNTHGLDSIVHNIANILSMHGKKSVSFFSTTSNTATNERSSMTGDEKSDAILVGTALVLTVGDTFPRCYEEWGRPLVTSLTSILQKTVLVNVGTTRLTRVINSGIFDQNYNLDDFTTSPKASDTTTPTIASLSSPINLNQTAITVIQEIVKSLTLLMRAEPILGDDDSTPATTLLLPVLTQLVHLLVVTAFIINQKKEIPMSPSCVLDDTDLHCKNDLENSHNSDSFPSVKKKIEDKTEDIIPISPVMNRNNAKILSSIVAPLLTCMALNCEPVQGNKIRVLCEKLLIIYTGAPGLHHDDDEDNGDDSNVEDEDDKTECSCTTDGSAAVELVGKKSLAYYYEAVVAAVQSIGILAERFPSLFSITSLTQNSTALPTGISIDLHLRPWLKITSSKSFGNKKKRRFLSSTLRAAIAYLDPEMNDAKMSLLTPTDNPTDTVVVLSPHHNDGTPVDALHFNSGVHLKFVGFDTVYVLLPLFRWLLNEGFPKHLSSNPIVKRILNIPGSVSFLPKQSLKNGSCKAIGGNNKDSDKEDLRNTTEIQREEKKKKSELTRRKDRQRKHVVMEE